MWTQDLSVNNDCVAYEHKQLFSLIDCFYK